MEIGTVKFFIPPWGWGFITHEDESGYRVDCLFHYSNIISDIPYKKLCKGQRVEFTKIKDSKGYKAIKIKPCTTNVIGQKFG